MATQWRQRSKSDSFPFRPGPARRSATGALLDRDFVDFHAVCRGSVFLDFLEISSSGFSGRFRSSSGASLAFSAEGFSGGAVPLVDESLGEEVGFVAVGSDDPFSSLPAGRHSFPRASVSVLPTLVSPPPPGVSSVSPGGPRVFGRVVLSGTSGVFLSVQEGSLVRMDADGAMDGSECGRRPVLTINGVPPSENGGIVLSEHPLPVPVSDSQSRQVIRISPSQAGIAVSLVDPDV